VTTEHTTATSPQDFAWLVNGFVRRVQGVTHALLLSADGFPLIASDAVDEEEGEQLAAISSGLLSLARNAAALFDRGTCEQIIVRLTRGYFLFTAIGEGAGLGVLTSRSCDMKAVAYELTRFVEQAGDSLTPQLRADLRRAAAGGGVTR
jgi:predicted regulator of Ras-like GTPase activity (Roadblock/LC7/MglB family)